MSQAKASEGALKRLDEIRGRAHMRSPTVRALAAFSGHTDCNLATLGFAARVDFDRLLAGTAFAEPFGQSKFAFMRGIRFENDLRENGHAKALGLLREGMKFDTRDARIFDLKRSFPATKDGMIQRARRTKELLLETIKKSAAAPNLVDGGVLSGNIGGILAHFEADALAARFLGPIHVGEIKSFPIVDGKVDSQKLGAALDQAAIYLVLLEAIIDELGGDPEKLVSRDAMLILPKNVGLQPDLRVQDVGARMTRVKRLLDSVPKIDDIAATYPKDIEFETASNRDLEEKVRVDALHKIADKVGTAYSPSCFSSCGNARFCRERAFHEASPCLAGNAALRLIPGVSTLVRADELSKGAPPRLEEQQAGEHLERAGRLYDELSRKKKGAV